MVTLHLSCPSKYGHDVFAGKPEVFGENVCKFFSLQMFHIEMEIKESQNLVKAEH